MQYKTISLKFVIASLTALLVVFCQVSHTPQIKYSAIFKRQLAVQAQTTEKSESSYIWPTRGTLTSNYGYLLPGVLHAGIDIAGPVGTPIVSAASGVVERAGWNSGGYGNLVEIRHADDSMTRYAQNSRIIVSPGQRVDQGQHIADMGSTGYSTGPHLHFEIHLPNRGTVNPMALLPSY